MSGAGTDAVFDAFRAPDGRGFSLAQTHAQLYAQLREAGLGPDALREVQRAYRFAMEWFAGAYRPGGRVFLAHAVGTASIAAAFAPRAPLVAAALLHSAYSHGDFGDGARGATAARRRALSAAVGDAVEARVHAYHGLRWDAGGIAARAREAPEGDPLRRDALLIALANGIDDYLDAAALPADSAARRDAIRSRGAHEVELAKRLGWPALADAHARAQALALAASAEAGSAQPRPRRAFDLVGVGGSFVVPPASHRLRLGVALRRLASRYALRRLRGRIARAIFLAG